jgi:NAD(P)-dependent dehydrogenase (short-subunit alcohol dehydrogenase family)
MIAAGDMTGKTAIITGAAAGLGRATALKLAAAGGNLCLVDINAAGLQNTAAEAAALDVETLILTEDLARPDAGRDIVAACVERFGRIDALCNVAAVFLPRHTTKMSDEDWDLTLAVNLTAPFKLIRAALPHLLEVNGAVVNVTSCAAFMGQAYLAGYSATKAALTHMTKSLAMEYMNKPVRINAVAPGGMMTALAQGLRNLEDPDTSLLSRITPLRGLVELDEVADMVAYLASDAASGYHGACINIDKGITAG